MVEQAAKPSRTGGRLLFGRYGKAQFLRDAQRLGLGPKSAFSHAALRRRRDRLLLVHHPDRGGDPHKAAEINATYERMLTWLDAEGPKGSEAQQTNTSSGVLSKFASRLGGPTAKLGALALAAVAVYGAFRRGGGKH